MKTSLTRSIGSIRIGQRLRQWALLRLAWRRFRRRPDYFGRFPLTRRVLAVNLLPIVLLGGLMLYLDRYERGLIETELQALETQGRIFAAALGEGAVLQDVGDRPVLVPSLAQTMMRRLVEPTRTRARLFLTDHSLVADSRGLFGSGSTVEIIPLPPPTDPSGSGLLRWVFGFLAPFWPNHEPVPESLDAIGRSAGAFPEVLQALDGGVGRAVRVDPASPGRMLSVAVPVRRYKQVLGAVLLSAGSSNIELQVDSVREDILLLFLMGLCVTIILSLFLASTIAQPVRALAEAARAVRHGNGRKIEIPDFSRRKDEIGELSMALADMTESLWQRMDAIERFAADVSHEIKNPLSSLRSAVETVLRIQDPEKQRRLMAIIHDDVQRLDRLITDISDASRLDAEMSRLERAPVSLAGMLGILADMHAATRDAELPLLDWLPDDPTDSLMVLGKEGRLVQVFRNLLANAVSFSPPGSRIRLSAARVRGEAVVSIDDSGPGIPEAKLLAIFDRFYSERPLGEKFGTHSGLGLSISKQIIDAHGGEIRAENRRDSGGAVIGARFIVRLPLQDSVSEDEASWRVPGLTERS